MAQKTASTHRSAFVRGSHRLHIVGYSERKALAGVSVGNSSVVKSGDFDVGGHTWALRCRFGKQGLASISLNLVSSKDATAMASLRIEDPLRRWPAAVWRSDDPKVFRSSALTGEVWRWELSVPEAFRGHQERYVEDDDRLAILCVVDVLNQRSTSCFIYSVVPPPTLSRDFLRLLFLPKTKSEPESSMQHRTWRPDVTFIVEEDVEIQAHKLVLSMQSPVFAAEFRWNKDESSRIRVDDMSASTFRAMLRFIYTGELPIKKPRKDASHADKEKCTLRRCVAMVLDLLVAADRYDLERLRTMCGNVLVECMDAVSVIRTLVVVHSRHSCQQLEDSCIQYIASHHDVYTAMKATEEYKELKESCCSFLLEITDKVAMKNMAQNLSSPVSSFSSLQCEKSTLSYNLSDVVHGTHEFTIPNFRAVQRSLGVHEAIGSGIFYIGGYAWKLLVFPSKSLSSPEEPEKQAISVCLELSTDLRTAAHITTSMSLKMNYPSATPPIVQVTKTFTEKLERTCTEFTIMKSAKSANDDSLTIHCNLTVTKEAYTSSSTTTASVGDEIVMPPSNMASHLEHLLVSEQGSDVRFLVEECDFHAHGLVIASRSPTLYELVAAAAHMDTHIVHVDNIKAAVFRSVLHFLYTDELPSIDDLVLTAEDMLAAACRFRLERMKIVCENFLAEYISKENALNTLKLAQRHHCSKLKKYCLEFMSLPHVTKHVLKTISL